MSQGNGISNIQQPIVGYYKYAFGIVLHLTITDHTFYLLIRVIIIHRVLQLGTITRGSWKLVFFGASITERVVYFRQSF